VRAGTTTEILIWNCIHRVAIECIAAIGYSKVRVAFDQDKCSSLAPTPAPSPMPRGFDEPPNTSTRHSIITATSNSHSVQQHSLAEYPTFTPRQKDAIFKPGDTATPALHARKPSFNGVQLQQQWHTQQRAVGGSQVSGGVSSTSASVARDAGSVRHTQSTPPIVGDVAEPFWVQDITENAPWTDPDELFLLQAPTFITSTDKRMFWEMARALLELPELSAASSGCKIRGAQDLTAVLKRPEYRVLWLADAAQHLPKEIATDLVTSAYVVPV
jgi:hypothetical protein